MKTKKFLGQKTKKEKKDKGVSIKLMVSKKKVGAEIWYVAEGLIDKDEIVGYGTTHLNAIQSALTTYNTINNEKKLRRASNRKHNGIR